MGPTPIIEFFKALEASKFEYWLCRERARDDFLQSGEVTTVSDKMKELLSRCKCGVHITVNEHRNYYQSAEQALEEYANYECPPEIEDGVRKVMIETNTVINVQFYPDTPIGSYDIYHHDLDAALTEALACLD